MRGSFVRVGMCVAVLAWCTAAGAQHATPGDIADGERAYGASCVVCHGPDGNLIPDIDFGRGLYRREYSDAELADIILRGMPGTPMPPNPGMVREQADRIVAYLRSLAERDEVAALVGDPSRGRELFFGPGECTDCHAVNGRGARHGPDLSTIGRTRGVAELELALRDPAAVVDPTQRRVELQLADGERVAGRLLNHDTFSIQLIDDNDRLRSFAKASLRGFDFVATPMPNYAERFSAQQIADVVSYLASLQRTSR